MTNWEKFKEVFGIPKNVRKSMPMNICNVVDCKGIECDDCFIYKNDMQGTKFWRREYKESKEERKKGHWIVTNDYLTAAYGSIDYVKCSCCGEESLEEGDYCPNCGSFMKGEFE